MSNNIVQFNSDLNKTAIVNIEAWWNRPPQGGKYPYVYVDGIEPGDSSQVTEGQWQDEGRTAVLDPVRPAR